MKRKTFDNLLLFLTGAAAAAVALALTGCTSTESTITEYDAEGKVIKTTVTTASVIKEITESTQKKTVVAWESGWAAYLSVSTATTEDPTPTFKAFAGKADKGLVSALPNQQNWEGIADAINATKYDLTVSKDGMSNGSSGTVTADAEGSIQPSAETAVQTDQK